MYRVAFWAFITNLGKYVEGELVGQWVEFPTTDEEIQEVLNEIGIEGIRYEEIFITDYESEINGLTERFGEYENLSMLNYLAEKIQDCDIEWLEAALELGENTGSVKDLINLIENQGCFLFFNDVENDYDLGYFYIHETWCYSELRNKLGELADYLNYEGYGRDARISEGGIYASNGCYICLLENITTYIESIDDIPYEYLLCA